METTYLKNIAMLTIPILLFASRNANASNNSPKHEINSTYVSSVNEFGFTLLKELAAKDHDHNIFISPASILFALSMADAGAAGTTRDSMRAVLHLRDFSQEEIDTCNSQLVRSLMLPDTSVELRIANSLWLNHQFKIKPEFTKECEEGYNAQTFVRDFSDANTVHELNGWVKQKTNGKIDEILKSLSPNDIMVILDAIYYYGKWTHPFDSSKTKEKPFFLYNGDEREYPRMVQHRRFDYFENSQYQAVSIPYGDRFSMCVCLPRDRHGLPDLIEGLDRTNPDELTSQLTPREGTVELPKFKISYTISLVKALKGLGMRIAFGADANFRNMTDTPACISNVIHKTYLDVNEKGTEAAAVTAVTMTMMTGAVTKPIQPFAMIIDHPFFCFIKDNKTGIILFSAAIFDPKPNDGE